MHDSDYCRKRAALAREEAFRCRDGEDAEIAGDLALAYSSLAHRSIAVAPLEDDRFAAVDIQD